MRFEEGRLTGRMLGEIETEEAKRRRHHLQVSLKTRFLTGEAVNASGGVLMD